MKIALVSLNQEWHNKDKNFAECCQYTQLAKEEGCTLIVFPEMTLSSYSLDVHIFSENQFESLTIINFGKLSLRNDIHILFGACLFDPIKNQFANHFCIAERNGKSRSIYTKIHPFTFVGEESVLAGGEALGKVELEGWGIGTTICYDLRFPEIYSILAKEIQMGIVIASWPEKRILHWETLLTARAIENQIYMVGVNRTGTDGNGLKYVKSSMVASPQGLVLKPLKEINEMDIYEVDLTEVNRYRHEFPTVRDKRFQLYNKFFRENYG